jgi:hypothetical protein
MRGRSCNAQLLKKDLLRMDDTSSLGDTIRKQGQFGVCGIFSTTSSRCRLRVVNARILSVCEYALASAPENT